ncbi:hypothetical protein BC835DRAFT_1416210 [Cytidiella melzeri]|nr:hypothetical protein BC835DRAFT_1416210 [Cytidiella melzeri]
MPPSNSSLSDEHEADMTVRIAHDRGSVGAPMAIVLIAPQGRATTYLIEVSSNGTPRASSIAVEQPPSQSPVREIDAQVPALGGGDYKLHGPSLSPSLPVAEAAGGGVDRTTRAKRRRSESPVSVSTNEEYDGSLPKRARHASRVHGGTSNLRNAGPSRPLMVMESDTNSAAVAGSRSDLLTSHPRAVQPWTFSLVQVCLLSTRSILTLWNNCNVLTNGFNTSSRGPLGAFVDLIRRTRMLIRLALTVAIICGIISGVKQGNPNNATDQQTALDLRHASLYIFLVVACLLLIVTVVLAYDKMATNIRYGPKHGIYVWTHA